jgi:lipopolysaccharide cholinephosphotransferase
MDFFQLFPDEREKGETQLKQCHVVLLRMLKIFDYLCSKYKIEYFLCSGTLKGAIMFQGFKPWDDDLDIGMTRRNYEKFVQCAVPELPQDIFFQTPESDPYFPSFHNVEAKLRDKYSSYVPVANQKDCEYHMGLMIDILVFDRAFLPGNFFIFLINRSLKFFFHSNGNKKRANVLKWIAKHSPFPLVYASSFICSRRMIKLGANYFRKEDIFPLIKVQFEDMETYIPFGWHKYLTRRYGNYMKMPVLEAQRGHHSQGIPDPFTPCNHKEILHWKPAILS